MHLCKTQISITLSPKVRVEWLHGGSNALCRCGLRQRGRPLFLRGRRYGFFSMRAILCRLRRSGSGCCTVQHNSLSAVANKTISIHPEQDSCLWPRVCTSIGVSIGTVPIKAAPRPPVPIPSVSLPCAWLPPHLNHLGAILLSLLLPLQTMANIQDKRIRSKKIKCCSRNMQAHLFLFLLFVEDLAERVCRHSRNGYLRHRSCKK